jgi:hypothetical protein
LPREGDGRKQAQDWLQQQGYRPDIVDVKHRYMVWAANVVPLVHNGDHPDSELAANRYQVSLPSAIEGFVRQQAAGTERIQVCLRGKTLVTHRGWDDMADDCQPARRHVQQLELKPALNLSLPHLYIHRPHVRAGMPIMKHPIIICMQRDRDGYQQNKRGEQ